MDQGADWIAFEHPLSERIRFLLRLEFLFAHYQHQLADRSAWGLRSNLRTLEHAIGLYLRLLRDSTQPAEHVAENGVFLHVPQAAYQLVRVLVPAAADVYPEISAGKHRVSVRFMQLNNVNKRNVQAA